MLLMKYGWQTLTRFATFLICPRQPYSAARLKNVCKESVLRTIY